ncbi:uncharacterized protein M421DRAFT_416531 [Didymella exigua CBS 183.55]|uniref:Uncharacterized protein n=1 Tax=Didymella exigua CBS 183.55 TaxID=1150837 RepID=A0A6A5S0E9_9PLEO|nr:uncharacterized protein M421DRAFT_416531 [Didymella exigua CBS 183.55]KAF1932934.1 hypothetical protein M421DRAFT_416531 [Didymella exigua CBS 183.55]
MAQLTPISSRKRPLPDDEAKPHGSSTCEIGSRKRQCASSSGTDSPSGLRLSIPGEDTPLTPPLSAEGAATMKLRLIIPQQKTDREHQRKINRRRADAERWKPKLQRPYPKSGEIKTAYPLKLMRHYPDASTSTQPNFVRPRIDESARVSRLLQQFPIMNTEHADEIGYEERSPSAASPVDQAIPLSTRREKLKETRSAHVGLQANKQITRSEEVQRLAWQSFSLPEKGRIDRGREAMMQSGLITDDLNLEAAGERNQLPQWKKRCTGRFAKGHQAAG